MKLVVVTPSLGLNENYIRLCAESVYNATEGGNCVHLVVVPEKRRAIVQAWLPRSIVLSEKGAGLYPALNQGFSYACDELRATAISYINDDDGLVPIGFKSLVQKFVACDSRKVVYGRVEYVDVNGASLGEAASCRFPGDLLKLFAEGIPGMTQQGTVFPRCCYESSRGFDTSFRLAADSDWLIRLLAAGEAFEFVNHKVAFYRRRPGQLSDDLVCMREEDLRSRKRAIVAAPNRFSRMIAKFRFRMTNVFIVAARVRRSGFHSTRSMFAKKDPAK